MTSSVNRVSHEAGTSESDELFARLGKIDAKLDIILSFMRMMEDTRDHRWMSQEKKVAEAEKTSPPKS